MSAALGRQAGGDVEPVGPGAGRLVECLDASCVFGRGHRTVTAVRQASVTVGAGTRTALMGRSGSGKSTLLHMLAGLQGPSSGSVRWPGLGGSPLGRPGVVGLIFQGPSLVPALTAAENAALPLVLRSVPSREALPRAHQALERLGIADVADRLPGELSGGQAQRVAIARVLAAGSRLILADEPTGRLDARTADHVLDVLLGAAAELQAALIVSTHDPRIAQRLPGRWEMADGHLTVGSVDQRGGVAPSVGGLA